MSARAIPLTAGRSDEHVPRSPQAPSARPTCFDEYIGQVEVLGAIRESVLAARRGRWQLDHYLFAGPPGLGKTTLATIIASELGAKLRVTSATAIEHKGALATLLTSMEDGSVLFIDEIHALDRSVAECLYSAMEDRVLDMPAGRRVIRVPLATFTVLGATTHAGRLPKPLLDRFGFVWQLRPYTLNEMQTIVGRAAARLDIALDDDACRVIARASRATPRIAHRLLRRMRDAAATGFPEDVRSSGDHRPASSTISGPLALLALARLGIDHLGLDDLDRRYLAIVKDRPVGIETICAELGEDRSTVEDVLEPFLIQAGLIKRSQRGRVATLDGATHLRSRCLSDSASVGSKT